LTRPAYDQAVLNATVLVVEDEPDLLEVLLRGLREEGYTALGAHSGREALERAAARRPDLLIIDIGLPDADGRDVCQALRAQGVDVPVLFLTARDALSDRLSGFAAGGDDYVTKPFAFDEIVARLRVWQRRTGTAPSLEVAGLRLDPVEHAVAANGKSLSLTPTEFRLLAALAARPGETLRRHEMVAAAWPAGAVVHDNTLDVYVGRLRRKLRDLGVSQSIRTAHGVGYALE
jgi:two-component system OmpR family response regulator